MTNIDQIETILTQAVDAWLEDPSHGLVTDDYAAMRDGKACRCIIGCCTSMPFFLEDGFDARAAEVLGLDDKRPIWALIDGFDGRSRSCCYDASFDAFYDLGEKFREKYAARIMT